MTERAFTFTGILILLGAAFLVTGCATLADAKDERGEAGAGTIKVYDASFDQTWNAVVDVAEESKLEIVSANQSTGEILAEHGMSLFSYGEKVAIYVEGVTDGSQTKVEVISKRALATNITATNWETILFESLDRLLP